MLSKPFTNKNSPAQVLCAADVVSIIQACKDSSVKHISFNGLTIELGEAVGKEEPLFQNFPDVPPLTNQQVEDKKSDLLRDLTEQQLLINDPQAYEKTYLGILE